MGGFRTAIESKDLDTIGASMAPGVTFRSPAVYKPYEGRDATLFVLAGVLQVFEDFRYVATVTEGPLEVLRFQARVGDRDIDGVDIVTYDDAGLITELTVMIRPLSGLTAVQQAMASALGLA